MTEGYTSDLYIEIYYYLQKKTYLNFMQNSLCWLSLSWANTDTKILQYICQNIAICIYPLYVEAKFFFVTIKTSNVLHEMVIYIKFNINEGLKGVHKTF